MNFVFADYEICLIFLKLYTVTISIVTLENIVAKTSIWIEEFANLKFQSLLNFIRLPSVLCTCSDQFYLHSTHHCIPD